MPRNLRVFLLIILVPILSACFPFASPVENIVSVLPTATPPAAEIDPEPFARVYLDAWKTEDIPTMYGWLSPLSQDAISYDEFKTIYDDIAKALTLANLDYEILSTLVKTRTAQIGYRIKLETLLLGEIQRDTVMTLTLEEDQWRVQWDHALILPELSGGNTLWFDGQVPARGNIYDLEGRALVAQTDAVSLGLIVGETDPVQEDLLFSLIWEMTGITPLEIRERLLEYREGWYMPLTEVAASQVESRFSLLSDMKGLVMEQYRSRYYFNSGVAPHVVGYVSAIQPEEVDDYLRLGYQPDERVGRSGLEQWAESYLVGGHGGVLYVVNPEGEIVTKLAESLPEPAQAVYTTIDKNLQIQTEQALQGFKGAVVVMEVDTGRILAMVSSPSFDPNVFEPTNYNSSFVLDDLINDPNVPTLNRASQGQYPLGSVFKIITMAAGLESGLFQGDSSYYCGHFFTVDGFTRNDWTLDYGVPPSGQLTLPEGLMRSCNPWFWNIGMTLYEAGMETMVSDIARGFGLGEPVGMTQIVEADGLIPDPQNVNDAINNAIGQGDTLVTPLQVVRFIAAVANGGDLLQPQIVDRIETPDGTPTFNYVRTVDGQLPVSQETIALLQQGMTAVVQDRRGTAYWRFINFPIPIAGKTGTAEAPPGDPHAWFAGYTFAGDAAEKPDVAIAVILEHGGEGSQVAAPIFKYVLEVYLYGRPLSPLPWQADIIQPPVEDVTIP